MGSTVLEYDFDALTRESILIRQSNGVMHDISDPLYIVMRFLDRLPPRKRLILRIEAFIGRFEAFFQEMKADPGDDMMTFMLTKYV